MDWEQVQNDFNMSFLQDHDIDNWMGTQNDVKIQRVQKWKIPGIKDPFFIPPTMSVQDIYLDYPWIAEQWRNLYGTPKLSDFVEPITRQELVRHVVSVKEVKPWRMYHGKDECQYMYHHIRDILDVCMRMVCGKYPRGINNRFVLGDAGCRVGYNCPNHAGAHNTQDVVDLNYCTHEGFNLTHYKQQRNVPMEYKGPWVNIWRDPFPMSNLKKDLYDAEKDYALYEFLSRIYTGNSRDFKVSTGLFNHYSTLYDNVDDVLHGDDYEPWCHYWHVHLYMSKSEINYDTEMIII